MFLRWILFGLALIMAGCGTRTMPPEVITIAQLERPPPPKKQGKIVLDAGHGGRDAGCASRHEDYEEKSLALSTTFLVQEALRKLGYEVVLTRNHDVYLPLSTRADLANTQGADLFVSIHYNYAISQEVEGIEVYYYKDEKNPGSQRIVESKKLAQKVLSSLLDTTNANSRGVKQANFAVVRETKMPAVLIEAGFLSNKKERHRLRDPAYLRALADGIARGVDRYLCP